MPLGRSFTITVVLAVALALPAGAANSLFKKGTAVLLTSSGRRVTLQVEVADTPEARGRGLMFRTGLPDTAGMLFIFEKEQRWGFWMKNTLIPLSIAFIDRRWRIVDIQDMAVAPSPQDGPFAIYEAKVPALYALEVRQDLFRRRGITVGARVLFTLYE